jgi:carbonic anhydrase
VSWVVMMEPVPASAAQIARFAEPFPNNARPVQPLRRRFVLY